jgi:perosamine synthetase
MKRPVIQRISELERRYVIEVLESGFRSSKGGAMTARLERAFADLHSMKFAISFVNGTATMHAALLAAEIGPGDEVIVPPLTMSSTTFAVLQAGATPVFADVDIETFNICPQSMARCVSARTRGVIPVALYGLPPDMDAIMQVAKQNKLTVIEDDAETMFARYKDKLMGTFGHANSFSFQSSKHLTAGEGGMILTNDEDLAVKIRRFNSLGYAGVDAKKAKITRDDIQDPEYSRHVSTGYNYRMPELCAAVVLGQLERSSELLGRRIEVAELFLSVIRDCSWLKPQSTPEDRTNTYWTLAVRMMHPQLSWRQFRRRFRELGGDGIYAAWKLTYLEPMFASGLPLSYHSSSSAPQKYGVGLCPNAELLQRQMLQFKTNYWDWEDAERQAEILAKTIKELS